VEHFKPKSVVPAVLTVTDIAGLVKGASEGKGLGNAFLSHIAAVDGLFHICRGFPGESVSRPGGSRLSLSHAYVQVTHVEGSVDPVRDLEIIHRELQLKDIQNLRTYIAKNARNVARALGGKEAKADLAVAVKALNWLLHGDFAGSADEWAAALGDVSKKASSSGSGEEATEEDSTRAALGQDIRSASWTGEEIEIVNKFQLLTAKPMTYLINLSLKQYMTQKCKWLEPVSAFVKSRGCGEKLIPFSAAFEAKFDEMGDTPERAKWLADNGSPKTMIPRIVKAGYKTLSLIHFFTCGPDEVRAWTVRSGSFAPRAAGVIHTDFEKGFICAEVQKYDDLHEAGSETAVKAAGKLRTEGKGYEVQDGDIMFFKVSVLARVRGDSSHEIGRSSTSAGARANECGGSESIEPDENPCN
jgi:obg-like ATPase 1